MRADVFLVERGHAATRSQAQRLIASGVQWRLAPTMPWNKVAKNSDEIPAMAELQLLDEAEAKYLSRGGLKLEGALRAVGLDMTGRRCLDVGQSTGGFTDCLLQQGAARVVGVDVLNARAMTAESLVEACEEARSEHIEVGEDNDTQPESPYAWMRNGGMVDEEYDDSDDAKEHEIEAFKAERKAKERARAAGNVPTVRRRRADRE